MPRTKEQNAEIRNQKRALILRVALKEFGTRSFDGLKIDDIVDACGFSHGLFYHYFNSKEAVYGALMEEREKHHQNFIFPAKDALNGHGLAGIKIAFEHANTLIRGPIEGTYYLKLDLLGKPIKRKSKTTSDGSIREVIYSLIREGQANGEIVLGGPDLLTNFLCDYLVGITERRISQKNDKAPSIEVDEILLLIKRG